MTFEPKSLDSLLDEKFPEQKWIINTLIPRDGLVLLSAAPASYKTWFVLDMAIRVAKGEQFLKHFETNQTGVLIVDEESGARLLNERFKLLQSDHDLPIHYISRTSRIMSDEYVEEIVDFCKQKSVGLVIFDSLIRFHNADENASNQMASVLNRFKRISDNDIACVVLHHNKKKGRGNVASNGELMRGSSDIQASCDIHTNIEVKENILTISQEKTRYMEKLLPFDVKFCNEKDKETEEEFCYFKALGPRKTKEDWDNLLKDRIWDFVKDNPGIKKTDCVKEFYEFNDGKDGKRKITTLIDQMIENDELIQDKGQKNAKYLKANDYIKKDSPKEED